MDTEMRNDSDLFALILILGFFGIVASICCVGGFMWAIFG